MMKKFIELILSTFLFAKFCDFCAPPISFGASTDYSRQMSPPNVIRLLGDPIQSNSGPIVLDNKPTASIKEPVDLFCYDFDEKCRWKNMEGLFIDELDWFQGSGFLDESKLRIATGTSNAPDGYYGIVATDKVQASTNKAVLVSDIIDCQMGPAELRFTYWTSPGVRIHVCTKITEKIYPNYDYCSPPVEEGDPGPAYISIPDLARKPFQIFIRAENFVMEASNLQGGFAIIDNLEYYGDSCSSGPAPFMQNGVEFVPLTGPFNEATDFSNFTLNSSNLIVENKEELIPLEKSLPMSKKKANSLDLIQLVAKQQVYSTSNPIQLPFTTEKSKFVPVNAHACKILNCTFTDGHCLEYLRTTDWRLAREPVGNPVTGIKGDASLLPYNKDGSFAYIVGPKLYSKFKTEPFEIENKVYFIFAYHKAVRNAEFRMIVKREDRIDEEVLFEAPRATIESKRWFRESRVLDVGRYDYIAFEVQNLPANSYIGIDEFVIYDNNQKPFCPAIKEEDFINSFDQRFKF